MADTKLILGDFEFSHAEIPERINFGGDQSLAINKFVGGGRTIDSMGRDDDDITWNGWFIGTNALPRARYLDGLRANGGQLNFKYFDFNYSVVIRSFKANLEKYYQIPYSISLAVIQDLSNPVLIPPTAGFLDAIFDLVTEALDIAQLIEYPNVTVALEAISSYLSTILPDQSLNDMFRSNTTDLILNAQSEVDTAISDLSSLVTDITI